MQVQYTQSGRNEIKLSVRHLQLPANHVFSGTETPKKQNKSDLLPETRINPSQEKAIRERYAPLIEKYNLNPVTIPKRPTVFCDEERAAEITDELMESQAPLLVLLGDIPISQYLNRVTDIDFSSLQEFTERYGYGNTFSVQIRDKVIKVLPLAHPRQIGALGTHNEKWYLLHKKWEINRLNEK